MEIKNARKDYNEIVNGKAGLWFDPGEYEDLIIEWFKNYAEKLLIIAEKESDK